MRAVRWICFIALPFLVTALLALLGQAGLFTRADGGIYDAFLSLRRPAAAAGNVLCIDIDEPAVTLAGPLPWTRDILADGLVLLREMDARYAVLDLPLAQRSAPALDPQVLRQTLPDALDKEFSQIGENIQSLFDAIRVGAVRPKDAARYVSDLVRLTAMAKDRLSDAAMGVERDDDALLGQAAAFFGGAYAPLVPLAAPDPQVGEGLMDLALQRQSVMVSVADSDPSLTAAGMRPAVLPLVRGARGGGFSAREADADGVRRSASLMAAYDGRHFAQIALAALLDSLGNPSVEVSPESIVLRGAVRQADSLPEGRAATLTLPLNASGRLLLDWPRGLPGDGMRHLSWAELIRHQRLENELVASLRAMDRSGWLSYLRSDSSLLDVYENGARLRRTMLAAGNAAEVEEWRGARALFFTLCDQYLGSDAEARILADAGRALQARALSEEEQRALRAERERAPAAFAEARATFARLRETRGLIQRDAAGAFCIVSPDAAQDPARAPRTPFGAVTSEAGVSAALVSTVLAGGPLREMPWPWAAAIAAALSLIVALLAFRLRPLHTLLAGLGAACLACTVLGLLFILGGAFVSPLVPCAAAAATGALCAAVRISTERRRTRVVRSLFQGRVSREGFRFIAASPDSLVRAPARRALTILCLAERGLPSAAGAAQPGEIAMRLAAYRTGVEEVIRGLDGMVAGTGGDRLTACFGAPRPVEDHARRACLAALRISAVEKELNASGSPRCVTRMAVDTGVCVAGVLGTGERMEYTLVGAPADLAARLETQNARFGTTILVTEKARDAAGPGFLTRRLDRIRFAGTEETLRLFELVAERDGAEAETVERVALFEEGLACFERGDYPAALKQFSRCLRILPGDGPAVMLSERCRLLIENPRVPPASLQS